MSRVVLLRLLLANGGQQEHASLELSAPGPIGHGDVGMIVRPIRRGGDALLVAQLQRLHAPYDLVHVASHARGVIEREHELVLGIDDEDGADGERQVLRVGIARVDHAVGGRDGAILVADDGKLDVDLVFTVGDDIVKPFLRLRCVFETGRGRETHM